MTAWAISYCAGKLVVREVGARDFWLPGRVPADLMTEWLAVVLTPHTTRSFSFGRDLTDLETRVVREAAQVGHSEATLTLHARIIESAVTGPCTSTCAVSVRVTVSAADHWRRTEVT